MAIYTRTGDQGTTQVLGGQRLSKADWQISAIGTVDELNSQLGLVIAMADSIRAHTPQTDTQWHKIEAGLAKLTGQLRDIQRDLFHTGSQLAGQEQLNNIKPSNLTQLAHNFANTHRVSPSPLVLDPAPSPPGQIANLLPHPQKLEQLINEMEQDLPRLENFILPGGDVLAAQLMLARSVCRRAERDCVRYFNSKTHPIKNQETKKPRNQETILPYLNRLSDYLFVSSRWLNWLMGEQEIIWKRH